MSLNQERDLRDFPLDIAMDRQAKGERDTGHYHAEFYKPFICEVCNAFNGILGVSCACKKDDPLIGRFRS